MNKNVSLIKEKPPRNDIKIKELLSGLEALGFEIRQGKGSHIIIKHKKRKDLYTTIPIPHGGNNCVREAYIRNIQRLIELLEE